MDQKKVVVISGASRGIGLAIAQLMAQKGYTVVGTSTSAHGVTALQQQLDHFSEGHLAVQLDVNDSASIKEQIDQIEQRFGSIHVLVNNAGITKDGLTLRMKDEDFDQVIQTNLRGAFLLCRAVMKGMMKTRQGRIINISSVIAQMGNMGQVNYAAAKAGLEGMTRSLARELGSRQITVNCIAPGFIETDMTKALDQQYAEQLLQQIPLGKMGAVTDVAALVDFLAGPSASYITGQVIAVNGGLYM